MNNEKKKVLILSLYDNLGGVPTMRDFVVGALKAKGYSLTIADRIPYGADRSFSVPFWEVLHKKPKVMEWNENGVRRVRAGVYFPELEFTYNTLDGALEKLIREHDHHVTVFGSCLGALPYVQAGVDFLAWAATPYFDDKKDRAAAWPLHRKAFDRLIISPVSIGLEKKVLGKGTILGLSEYTSRYFAKRVPGRKFPVMPMPIDDLLFNPNGRSADGKTIGLIGRFDDERKNVRLFLEAAALCRKKVPDLKIRIIGGKLSDDLARSLDKELDIAGSIEMLPAMDRGKLPEYYKSLDVFVVSSHQEGLCIGALEAMGCGCPVVSTRCGGPEEFVEDGGNGYFSGFDAKELSEKILAILQDKERQAAFSKAARRTVQERYNFETVERIFWGQFNGTFS
jgi:glycosyltransferase involved in cell wall biosynthesis